MENEASGIIAHEKAPVINPSTGLLLFNKVVDIIIKMMIPVVILALLIGVARLFLDLGAIFKSDSINTAFDSIITNTLSMFVVIELFRSIVEFFEIHRLRITFIIDGAIVFILREVMVGLYSHNLAPLYVSSLALLIMVLGGLRTLAILYSPDKSKEAV
ncbi:MAG: phosphate-starvation-inducible PsiE family protein [Nitrospirota bacterium]